MIHMMDVIVKGAYIAMWFVGAGLVSGAVVWAGMKCDKVKEFLEIS
jgi:hypothetical protein